jgi:putative membrane protein insertion efficiency factor
VMKIIITILISISTLTSYGQIRNSNFKSILLKEQNTKKKDLWKHFKKSETEIDMAISTLYVFYKGSISSQDGSTCSFTPSCSTYAVEAVEKHGVLKGTMMFFDRYTRCNSLSPSKYKFSKTKQRLIDDVGTF